MDCPHCDSSATTERSDVITPGYHRFLYRSCGYSFDDPYAGFSPANEVGRRVDRTLTSVKK